jgi:hypothetical protein
MFLSVVVFISIASSIKFTREIYLKWKGEGSRHDFICMVITFCTIMLILWPLLIYRNLKELMF